MLSRHSNFLCSNLLSSSTTSFQIPCHPRQNPETLSFSLSSYLQHLQLVNKFYHIPLSKYLFDLFCLLHYHYINSNFGHLLDYYDGLLTFPQNIFIFSNYSISFTNYNLLCYLKYQNTTFWLVSHKSSSICLSWLSLALLPWPLSLSPQTPYPIYYHLLLS